MVIWEAGNYSPICTSSHCPHTSWVPGCRSCSRTGPVQTTTVDWTKYGWSRKAWLVRRNMMWTSIIQCSVTIREYFVYAPSQWEMRLHCNIVYHWLCAFTKWSLYDTVDFLRNPHNGLPIAHQWGSGCEVWGGFCEFKFWFCSASATSARLQ